LDILFVLIVLDALTVMILRRWADQKLHDML